MFFGEVFRDQFVGGATKVIDAIGAILADIDLAIGVGDPIDNIHF